LHGDADLVRFNKFWALSDGVVVHVDGGGWGCAGDIGNLLINGSPYGDRVLDGVVVGVLGKGFEIIFVFLIHKGDRYCLGEWKEARGGDYSVTCAEGYVS